MRARDLLDSLPELGIASAAKALHRSQPAISRRIALLEQELGVPLFERIAGRTMLSDAGRVMVPYAERAVAALRAAIADDDEFLPQFAFDLQP